jgi:hypothetical protein
MPKPKFKHEPISNEIFETFRLQEKAKKINEAIELIVKEDYVILDLENKIINKYNYNKV